MAPATARNTQPVAIAGGGIGGLACALALARKGFRSLVLEQAREFGEVGVGLHVAPNALSVLDALGVGAAAKKNALMIERLLMMDAVTGEEVANIPCDARFERRFGNPYAVAHRAHIHGPLLDACRAHELIELRTNSRVTGFELQSPGVSVALDGGERIAAAALIGADGVSSNVRKRIVGDGDPLPGRRHHLPRHDSGRADAEGSAEALSDVLGRARLAHDLLSDQRLDHVQPRLHGADRPGRSSSEAEEFAPDVVLPYFVGRCEIPDRVLRIPKSFRRYVIVHREPVDNWTMGVATLLGDAAHPMVQYIAQGAAMALEDAICLGNIADECDGDFARAFQRYQDIRIVRTARVQISSMMMSKLNHAKGVERKVRNSLFEGRTAEEFYDRLAWLYTPPPYVK